MKKRQQSESLKKALEQAREKHKQFVEDTGIDYKALAASGFDANSGRNIFTEIVEGFEHLKQERDVMKDKKPIHNEGTGGGIEMKQEGWNGN